MVLDKFTSIKKHLKNEKYKKILMQLSKDELIERYFYQLSRTIVINFFLGFIIGILYIFGYIILVM